jgi:ketosteroid isomerase-like protein
LERRAPELTGSRQLPPVAAVVSFIDCINRGDVEGLGRLMTEDHALRVFDEEPLLGRQANVSAWHGYVESFSDYVVYPQRIAEQVGVVAVLGWTTGSHLGLPDEEERRQTLIWVAEVVDGLLRSWTLVEDNVDNRRRYGLGDA